MVIGHFYPGGIAGIKLFHLFIFLGFKWTDGTFME